MEIFKVVVGLAIFVGVVALMMSLIENLSKKIGSKAIYISIIFVIPFIISLVVVVSSYQHLKWYEVIYIPFMGSAFILAAILLVLVQFNPEVVCIPFQYIWKLFSKRKK